ncbi:cytochrome P450 [Pyrenochaeta sp. DS3sAY3a]|nr:cytochrome P450 [Pyrenochaeta sp. DS3sAY3a]
MLWLRRRLPPGPFPLPIVGNMLDLPSSKPWTTFEQWSLKYDNPLITVWIGRTPNIIVNDCWTASELMEKRADIYSSRPKRIVMGDVCGISDSNQVLLKYNDHWRAQRKVMHLAVGSQAVRKYRGFQADESTILMRDILASPVGYISSIERYSCSVVSILGWGRRINERDDYIVKLATTLMDDRTGMEVPGAYWMEAIPEMQYLPPWIYPLPRVLRQTGDALKAYWWALTEEGARAPEHNFAKSLIASGEQQGLKRADISEMTANLIGGGVDTSSSTMLTCILALCVFPETQDMAQEEIDRVCGSARAPDWDDIDSLPYCQALFKETLRWRSTTVLGGLPHAPIRDDVFRDYLFPQDITIVGNLWAIHRNPRDFPDPDVFDPERYLDSGKRKRSYPNARGHNAFGWGRRACSGQPLAEQGLIMAIVRLLWAFKVRPGLDAEGKRVKLDINDYTDSENMRPHPFLAQFEVRSEEIRTQIVENAMQARKRLAVWDGKSSVTVEQFLDPKNDPTTSEKM